MAFLDNSGDIILDAVLTDTGRYRLAKADGSFRISKFALGDDEINYGLYDKNNPSGSAYYDLSILQTPILEAFTNNSISLKSKLITISRNDYLYMPILKLNTLDASNAVSTDSTLGAGVFLVSVDEETRNALVTLNITGHMRGDRLQREGTFIRVDQGIDSTEISPAFPLQADQKETQYIIEVDNRLASIRSPTAQASLSYLDDDQMASYFFSFGTDTAYIETNREATDTNSTSQVIRGPRGHVLKFGLLASQELNTSTFLFDKLGGELDLSGAKYRYIDSTVRVIGATTGYRLDIPLRFLKKIMGV